MSPATHSRRSVLRLAGRAALGAALVGGTGSLLEACAAPAASSGSTAPGAAATVGYQLSWTKDYEFAGSYLADDKGYWKSRNLTVDLLAGGSSADPLQVVASKRATVGSAQVDKVAQLVADGGTDLKIVGALFQKNGLNILSRSDKPISSPQDLTGKRIGVFASNNSAWELFLQLNKVDRSTITEVPVQYDVTPLINGEVDGYQGYAGGELTTLQSKGVTPVVMLLADFGYNPVSAGYVVRAETLADPAQRTQIVDFLRGEIMGWQDVVYNNAIDEGARLTVDTYGRDLGLDLPTQTASLQALVPYIATPTTQQKGMLWIADESISASQVVLDNAEIPVKMPDILDPSLLQEIYAGGSRI
jgi:ABC-type nitrate/sulfonate/bicarbonate transport system substrate-binding protein